MDAEKNKDNIENKLFELIIDDLTNNISPAEKDRLSDWVSNLAENQKSYHELKELWDTIAVIEDSEKFNHKTAFQTFNRTTIKRREKYHTKRIFKYAAAVILLLLGGYYTLFNSPKPSDSGNDSEFALSSVSVPDGSTSKIEFKDGSRIWMNSRTNLELVDSKSKSDRRIKLDGEAFLEITRNEVSPFTVETQGADVKVLGTTFNVNAYSDENELKITLESGSVEVVTDYGEKTTLAPSEQLVYDLKTKKVTVKEVNLKKELAWKTNSLIFTGESFAEIAGFLEKKFRVKIEITNKSLAQTHFTGDFINNETIEHILDVMSSKNRFKYRIKDNTIYIY